MKGKMSGIDTLAISHFIYLADIIDFAPKKFNQIKKDVSFCRMVNFLK